MILHLSKCDFDMGCFKIILLSTNMARMVSNRDGKRVGFKLMVLPLQMIFRLGLLVAVSIAVYAIRELTIRSWNSSTLSTNCSDTGEDTEKNDLDEEEKVNGEPSDIEGGDNSSPEFRDLLQRESKNPFLDDNKKEEDKVPQTKMENNKIELERLMKLVMELKERVVKLEGEMLMYDGLKDRRSSITELRKQLETKEEDISLLNITISSLQAERKKLQEEIVEGALMKKELEDARGKIKELQRQLHLDAKKTKGHLLLLKRQVSALQATEEEAVKKEAQRYKKLKLLKDLEVELGELKWKNRELQHEKQELTCKLDVMEASITTLITSITESEIISKKREEAQRLRRANEDLTKQLEELQMNRLSEVEELVYFRWVNACLRYELRDNQIWGGQSARDLNKSLSPNSKEKAKQLMLEYAGLKLFGEVETDQESNFSHPFSTGIEDSENTSIGSSRSRSRSFSEKHNSDLGLKKISRSQGGSSSVSSLGIIWSRHTRNSLA